MFLIDCAGYYENYLAVSVFFNVHTLTVIHITFTFMYLTDAFIQSDLQAMHFFVSMCVPWESNPQPLRC